MLVTIFPASKHSPTKLESPFALQQDHWNDFSFQTLYHLHYNPGTPDAETTYLGGVKILKRGQTTADRILLQEPFDALGEEFCSLGTSLDYYQRLNTLPAVDRAAIVDALRDVAVRPELRDEFAQEEGWSVSLIRDNKSWKTFLDDAYALYHGNLAALPDLNEEFSFQPGEGSSEILFNFSAPEPISYLGSYRRVGPNRKRVLLPQRVIVVVGRNGSGKSTLLSRIAHLAFASPVERAKGPLSRLGQFNPEAIGFMRVITVSYSAFDSFTVPGDRENTLSQLARDIEKGEGRFVYCGLRDIVSEARDDIDQAKVDQAALDAPESIRICDRRTTTKLKSIDQLAAEFAHLIQRIDATNKRPLLTSALEPLLQDPSFAELGGGGVEDLFRTDAIETFLAWSTGHKIALHVVASLVANAAPRSLVLFDEPEMHLHPPLAAALMHAVRVILEEVNALCIVATHSPVILQETLAKHVRTVQRVGDVLKVKVPALETFGENVGIITYDTFGLTSSTTDFHEVLDLLVDWYDTLEEIDTIFSPGLSGQARAYVMSKLAAKGKAG